MSAFYSAAISARLNNIVLPAIHGLITRTWEGLKKDELQEILLVAAGFTLSSPHLGLRSHSGSYVQSALMDALAARATSIACAIPEMPTAYSELLLCDAEYRAIYEMHLPNIFMASYEAQTECANERNPLQVLESVFAQKQEWFALVQPVGIEKLSTIDAVKEAMLSDKGVDVEFMQFAKTIPVLKNVLSQFALATRAEVVAGAEMRAGVTPLTQLMKAIAHLMVEVVACLDADEVRMELLTRARVHAQEIFWEYDTCYQHPILKRLAPTKLPAMDSSTFIRTMQMLEDHLRSKSAMAEA